MYNNNNKNKHITYTVNGELKYYDDCLSQNSSTSKSFENNEVDSVSSWKTERGNGVALFESEDPWYISKRKDIKPITDNNINIQPVQEAPIPESKFNFRNIICSLIILLALIILIRRYINF